MSRRRWLLFLAVVLCLATLCTLETQRILTGWLYGEAFYRGRPTTYWRGQLTAWREMSPWTVVYGGSTLNLNGGTTKLYANLVIDVDARVDVMPSLLRDVDAADPVHAATLLGEGLACATSPTPFLIARPRSDAATTAVWVEVSNFTSTYGASYTLFQARSETFWDRCRAWLGMGTQEGRAQPALLEGDPAAEPVLRELGYDPDVGELARQGLQAIREKQTSKGE
jgi:hypothetical protein